MKAIDIFEAAANYRKAHNRATVTGAFARNYDHPNYSGIRKACRDARHHFDYAVMMKKTAAHNLNYSMSMEAA